MTDLHHVSMAEAARLLRLGTVTSRDLTDACLERIAAHDAGLNAYITVCTDTARTAADRADAEIARGLWRGPLHGIPVALKDIYDTAGILTTCHSKLFADRVPETDSDAWARLSAGGAVLLGKTATHEFATGGPSFDLPWPPARNPWNPDHIPAGSSSGSGAAVAAGMAY
ncbi:MAG: amidase, partial [Alphaproteobacteria bacterium]|nr:amidase [Alphaproteobacteria bacterium]